MRENIIAFERSPHAVRKLIRFTGFVPANIIDKGKKLIATVKIPQSHQNELLKAKDRGEAVDIEYKGNKYHTTIGQIFKADGNGAIDEVELICS